MRRRQVRHIEHISNSGKKLFHRNPSVIPNYLSDFYDRTTRLFDLFSSALL